MTGGTSKRCHKCGETDDLIAVVSKLLGFTVYYCRRCADKWGLQPKR